MTPKQICGEHQCPKCGAWLTLPAGKDPYTVKLETILKRARPYLDASPALTAEIDAIVKRTLTPA